MNWESVDLFGKILTFTFYLESLIFTHSVLQFPQFQIPLGPLEMPVTDRL